MITAHESAPSGVVMTLNSYNASTFTLGSAVLCRNNAPLVTFAFQMIHRDIPVRILGKEIGEGLAKIIKSFKLVAPWDSWRERLEGWYQRESKRVKRAGQREALDDKAGCLRAIMSTSDNEADALRRIDKLFVNNVSAVPCVTLSTGHKAKGQEWDKVFILDQHLIPSRWCSGQAELTQERNLLYVMVTRAKTEVTYIKSNCWKTTTQRNEKEN